MKRGYNEYVLRETKKPFFGEFVVEKFFLNGKEISADTLMTRRWKSILINEKNASIQSTDGASITWLCHVTGGQRKMMLISPDLSSVGNFSIEQNENVVTIAGLLVRDSIKVIAKRNSENSFLLVDRGFHWINEFPFNR
jgi:hypothetical protein